VNLKEKAELIRYYLRFLKLRREEFIKNYKPSDWELLSREEHLQIAIARIHREQNNTIEAQILINETIREYKDYKREQRRIKSKISYSINPSRKRTNWSLYLLSELLDY
jgi:hypothetical protein